MAATDVAAELLARFRDIDDAAGLALEQPVMNTADWAGDVERGWQVGIAVNPRFEFPSSRVPERLRDLARDADRAAARYGDPILDAFANYLHDQITWTAAVATHDADAIATASTSMHGGVPPSLAARAQEIVHWETEPDPDPGTVPPPVAAAVLEHVLDQAGACGWSCAVSDGLVARMSVSAARQQVRLNGAVTFSADEIVRLAVHEIGVHVLRSVHGARQANPLLALGIGPRHLQTEEGLAVWLEEQTGVLTRPDLRKYGLRVLAVDAASAGGFADVYAAVRPFTTAANAYALAVRVKRGIADTSRPGGYVKDKVYLEGLLRARRELAGMDARLLWAGKVSFDLLPQVIDQVHDGRIAVPDDDPVQRGRALATVARQALAELRGADHQAC